jgi:hypothetical protein
MTVIEITQQQEELTQRQRWSHYFALAFGLLGLLIGVNLRDTTLGATTQYTDTRAGIRAFYPENWLLDTSGSNYVFRVRDTAQQGYKTTIQVAMIPIGPDTSTRNVLEALTLSRSQILGEYTFFNTQSYDLQDQPDTISMSYAFAESQSSPFLASLPSVVRGLDILTIKRGQAIIISFLSDAQTYEQNLPLFEQFLSDLEF